MATTAAFVATNFFSKSLGVIGGPGAIRTPDPQIRSLTAGIGIIGENRQPATKEAISFQYDKNRVQTDSGPEKENPDALAGATGAETIVEIGCQDDSPNLPAYATAFIDAVANLPREDRLPLLELAVDHYRAGQPIPPLIGIMDEAAFWADMASRTELKAYTLACYNRLTTADQRAFLEYVKGEAAA